MGRLDGRVAIVTGAARGIGEAMARLFAAEGASVVVADLLDDEVDAVAASIRDRVLGAHLDVTDESSWREVLAQAVDAFGVPDVLVNNAGILAMAPLVETTIETFRSIVDVDLLGPFLGMKVVGGAMAEAGHGSIVNVSSAAGMIGFSNIGAYAAAKWGLRGITKTAALEFGPSGVRVNSIHPGGVTTPMVGVVGEPALGEPPAPGTVDPDPVLAEADLMAADQPIARMGRPVEIARLALFLASDESSYCTGAEFVVDGGQTAGHRIGD
ncbi:MAG: SDR family NAD(P)-dependent oxidoreductase [Actinomycetes bacterium]